jgi:8-oxo-dGTP pyrophosphatase MutT (NUDIX family)
VVLQRRRRAAKGFPGLLDLSATGHLAAGEAPLDGIRELREELGIEVDPAMLVPLGRRRLVDDSGEGRNREIAHVYLLADDRALHEFVVDHSEIDGVVEMTVADLLEVVGSPGASVPAAEWDGEALHPITVSATDLVPDIDGYWTVLAIMAERFAAGQRPLAI